MKKFIQKIKGFFVKPDVNCSLWEYGTCSGSGINKKARRNKINGEVQYMFGEHPKMNLNLWTPLPESDWKHFIPTNCN